MKRIILLLLFTIGGISFSIAQDSYTYNLRPDVYEAKEVVLQSSNAFEELKLTLGLKWMQKENQLQLTFDRKAGEGNDTYLLFFPIVPGRVSISDIADCKSRKKNVWTKAKGNELNYLSYFLESDHLDISDYGECYKSLANNNEEEFSFEIKTLENFTLKLTGIYAAKIVKRPWYYFSSRDKKLEYKINPITLSINFPRSTVTNLCGNSGQIIAYINAQKEILRVDRNDLADAQRNQNYTLCSLIKDLIRRKFIETNDKCEKYAAACDEIAQAIKSYNNECESIMSEQCKTAPPSSNSSGCSLSEQELTTINNRLKNLQMQINLKKKEGSSTDSEAKEYRSIKTTVNEKLTPECRRKYKSSIDAFVNYCTKIESLF